MSETLTDFAYFDTIDYKNEFNTLSTYCLSITPLTFRPRIPSVLNNTRLVWDFGDGTQSTELTATHTYNKPGNYTTRLVVFDCSSQSRLASYSAPIQVVDLVTHTIGLSTINTNHIELSTGRLLPINVTYTQPWHQPGTSVFFSVSGSNTTNFFNLTANKFNHLTPSNSILTKTYNSFLSGYELVEIDRIDFDFETIYAKISGSSIIQSTTPSIGSIFAGISSTELVYFKDDRISPTVLIKFYIDRTKIHNTDYYNTLTFTLSAQVKQNTDANSLSITSNGLDNEGYDIINSFNISTNKFINTKIPFVVKVKDADGYTIKLDNIIPLSAVNITISGIDNTSSLVTLTSSQNLPIFSLTNTLSSLEAGVFRGYFIYLRDNYGLTSATINVSANISIGSNQFSLTGSSTPFNILPINSNSIYKQYEDIDMTENIKSMRMQEILLDKTIFFDTFVGSIMGNVSSSYDSVGKKIFEKIANYASNNVDVDTAEITQLESILHMLGYTSLSYNSTLFNSPNKVQRAVNILSIPYNRLMGSTNKFSENFDKQGSIDSTTYGLNLGKQIDTLTYRVSAGSDIVAYERFSGDYTLINSLQPLSGGITQQIYPLSSYTTDWGWPLVLPAQFNVVDFDKYYIFYEYNSGISGEIVGSTIDFDNFLTTLSSSTPLSSIYDNNGIAETILSNSLYDGLGLFVS